LSEKRKEKRGKRKEEKEEGKDFYRLSTELNINRNSKQENRKMKIDY